jgi:acyl-coenzyme A synthetase/AMP-(fatty) acid ligase
VDGWAHQDIRPGAVVAWPTNLGWMMGPWLVYAALLNGGTIALYQVGSRAPSFGGPAGAKRLWVALLYLEAAASGGDRAAEGAWGRRRVHRTEAHRIARGAPQLKPAPQPQTQGAPLGRDFGDFVESAGVEVLGLVPSIVKAWRASGCMAGVDWRRLRCFSSTGEASAPEDYHWLASRVLGYRPVIE